MHTKSSISIAYLQDYPHYAAICAQWSHTQWYLKRDIPFTLNIKAYEARCNKDSLPLTIIALDNDLPVGMATLKEDDLWHRKDLNPWLASLYVLPEFRNQGIGKNLINEISLGAKRIGHSSLYLFLDHREKEILHEYYSQQNWNFLEDDHDNDNNQTSIFKKDLRNI